VLLIQLAAESQGSAYSSYGVRPERPGPRAGDESSTRPANSRSMAKGHEFYRYDGAGHGNLLVAPRHYRGSPTFFGAPTLQGDELEAQATGGPAPTSGMEMRG